MSGFPEGIITFLFTDVEGSTRLARELGDERWAKLLEAHRGLVRAAFAAHGGFEVDTQGDAFFAVFRRASEAVEAAIDAHGALAEYHSDVMVPSTLLEFIRSASITQAAMFPVPSSLGGSIAKLNAMGAVSRVQ